MLGNYNAGKTEAATGSLDSLRGISLPKFPVVAHMQNSATPKTHASKGQVCLTRPMIKNIFHLNHVYV